MFFFGGAWTQWRPGQFEPQASYLAGRGMVAIRADYRVKNRHRATPADGVEDAKSAIRWVRQNASMLGVDPDRIVAAGGSAGGHLAACTACVAHDGKVTADLKQAGASLGVEWIAGFDNLAGENGGGDPYQTDGKLAVVLVGPPAAVSAASAER